MSEIILVRGLPGSGKSTWAADYCKRNANTVVCEADDYFVNHETGIYTYDFTKIKEAHAACQDKARGLLEIGKRPVVSNTFTMLWEMEPYYKLAEKFKMEITVLTMSGEYSNVHGVPLDVIEKMRARWQETIIQHWDYS